ncbi:uncharacterized protein e(y)3 isoform X2 [Chelonus insularis]|uniref:uncharacterized protein e(y)3 isoform X2 n=1 Tax=Chelonus insularis TaxID=460826 RepID=UPI00158E3BEF|nr:uncharacterized protein LOC118072072 isoform X2 [Chelonus insularis]
MSESSKMGLLGSKEENSKQKNDESNKEESPERYAPYSANSDSETYDTEALSIMDINDIIGVQSEPVGDSTLESEFAALSEIITDSQSNSMDKNIENNSLDVNNTTSNATNDEEITKLDSKLDEINSDTTENNSSAKSSNNQICIDSQSNLNDVVEQSKILDVNKVEEKDFLVDKSKDKSDEENSENKTSQDEQNEEKDSITDSTDISGINKSLQLIGEAYISEDSQETDLDELQIGKEPKVIFSCKPLIDKHSGENLENDSINQKTSSTDSTVSILTLHDKSVASSDDRPMENVTSTTDAKDVSLENIDISANASKVDDNLRDDSLPEDDCEQNIDKTDDIAMTINTDNLVEEMNSLIKTEDCLISDQNEPPLVDMPVSIPEDVEETKDDTVVKAENKNIESEVVQKNDVENITDSQNLENVIDQKDTYKCVEQETTSLQELCHSKDKNETGIELIMAKTDRGFEEEMEIDEIESQIKHESEKKLEETNEETTLKQEIIRTEVDISLEFKKKSLDHTNDNIAEIKTENKVEEINSIGKPEENEQDTREICVEEKNDEIKPEENSTSSEFCLLPENIEEQQSENSVDKTNLNTVSEKSNVTNELNNLNEENDGTIDAINEINESLPINQENSTTLTAEINLPESPKANLDDVTTVQMHKQLLEGSMEINQNKDTIELTEEISEKSEKKVELPEVTEKDDEAQDGCISNLNERVPSPKASVNADSLLDDLNKLDDDFSSKSEDLCKKLEANSTELKNNDPLDELLGLDLMSSDANDDSLIQIDKPDENQLESVEYKDDLTVTNINENQLVLPKLENNQKHEILDKVQETGDNSESMKIDINKMKPCESSEEPIIDDVIKEKNTPETFEQNKKFVEDIVNPFVSDSEQPELDTSCDLHKKEKLEVPNVTESFTNVNSGTESLQLITEISELESAVKFLQESEKQDTVVVSEESSVKKEKPQHLYSSNQEMCENSEELVAELDNITRQDTIAISEAEIINEAAKLENEKKQLNEPLTSLNEQSNFTDDKSNNKLTTLDSSLISVTDKKEPLQIPTDIEIKQVQNLITTKTTIPKISILEERLKEPPKIEIPMTEPRISNIPTSPKTSLLIQRDSKMTNYYKMLDSPKISIEKTREDLKSSDSLKKDSEKHDFENAGSPRIILKIAKSAITECGEPRSPKSPKIRSATNSPNPEDSPGQKLGKIKLKLSKGGHPAIINENSEETGLQWHTESSSSLSPLGMKIKLSKTGDASIIQSEKFDNQEDRRLDSPLGMKIKLSKTGDAAIVQQEMKETKHKTDLIPGSPKRTDSPLGMKIKLFKTGDASILPSDYEDGSMAKKPLLVSSEKLECKEDNLKRVDSPMGMKIKLSKKGGSASIISPDGNSGDSNKEKLEIPEVPKRTESPLGMKIKLSKTGDASIIYSEVSDNQQNNEQLEFNETISSKESSSFQSEECNTEIMKKPDSSIGVKIKLSKDGDATIVHSEKQDEDQKDFKRIDSPIGMKIKLSKTGDASIVQPQTTEISGDPTTVESMKIKLSKSGHPTIVSNDNEILQNKETLESHVISQKQDQFINKGDVMIEPFHLPKKQESEISHKRKDTTTVCSADAKKSKLDNQFILPDLTIQRVVAKRLDYEQGNTTSQRAIDMNQEVSITQIKMNPPVNDNSMGEKLKSILIQPPNQSNSTDDCEIIEHRPELIIVNENSNSSQDIMIIDEVPTVKIPEIKLPKKRGRPRRNPLAFPPPEVPQDPLALDDSASIEPRENERPKRTCRNLKSYAPPKRGRGRGRGKRKYERIETTISKRPRLEKSLTEIEKSTTALITIDDETPSAVQNESPELYKALKQPSKTSLKEKLAQTPVKCTVNLSDSNVDNLIDSRVVTRLENDNILTPRTSQVRVVAERLTRAAENIKESKEHSFINRDQNWLTPTLKKQVDNSRNDGISMIQVIDEETRMSAECLSRSQTPARNIAVNETPVNEESQGSVVSTATTESEKVKVKNRRMEINFDPDEGPFTVDKIAEYEWPPERKGETFMLQEQISQYLGVKSFKRKYPELKRRIVDMEERNYLRENGLVNESMCDMGLTAICSSEVLDIMCSDFPDHYEEYRKHMRERQIKEHSKKQKELTAAATAEKNRIDLAEMAVQSAVSWNVSLNKARKETRKCSLDLQTFTIHVPKKQQRINEESKVSHYPVALIPGQYTDYYREYTPAELRYYPLNTVLYGPMRPNERKFDSQSEGSQSDSDSDSSSDDSSCSSSEGTQDTEESQSTMEDVDIELSNQKDKSLRCKMCLKNLNKNSKQEVLIQCGTCHGHVHPSCIDLTLDMVPHIQAYAWQCTDCKTCVQCHDPADEDKMLFCDMCDRGYHIYCVGLRRVPQGRWHCQECAICASCGSREAGGVNAERNSVAQWQHEYKKGDKNTRVYVSTLCVPCSKLWRKGRYCPLCSRCHTVQRLDLEENLVHCSACDKYLHLECVENKDLIIDKKNYQCEICMQNRQRTTKTSSSKAIRA